MGGKRGPVMRSRIQRVMMMWRVSPSFPKIFSQCKNIFLETPSQGSPGVREMWDGTESLLAAPNYNTPVKDLEYKHLLTSTFTVQTSSKS
jgi:hypothetical protein